MNCTRSNLRKRHSLYSFIKLFCIVFTVVVSLNLLALYKYVNSKYKNENIKLLHDNHKHPSTHTVDHDRSGTRGNGDMIPSLVMNWNSVHFKSRKLLNLNSTESPIVDSIGDYPNDLFTLKQKEQGWIVLHVIAVLYTFLALAIVCDEFFVPALHVISSKLKISDDVAGATFMAAGGSAPELFTSIIGLFFSNSQVGFGTIVGSAVFNVLFVIGMCAMFSKTLLHLTWWPLLRDSLFYIAALTFLIGFFYDGNIEWYEALCLFLVYVSYVAFMIINNRAEIAVKKYLAKHFKSSTSSITPTDEKRGQSFLSFPGVFAKNTFRHGALQLVIHTLDPIAEVAVENKFQQMKHQYDTMSNCTQKDFSSSLIDDKDLNDDIAMSPFHSQTTDRRSFRDSPRPNGDERFSYELQTRHISVDNAYTQGPNSYDRDIEGNFLTCGESPLTSRTTSTHCNSFDLTKDTDSTGRADDPNSVGMLQSDGNHNRTIERRHTPNGSSVSLRNSIRFSSGRRSSRASSRSHRGLASFRKEPIPDEKNKTEIEEEDGDEEEEGPVDLSWPDTCLERIYYVIKAPLVFLMVVLIPDVRRPSMKKFFPLSFIMSIVLIGLFSYVMLWMASEVGRTAGISVEIMGLTFIAAGTSIPDLITSVVVARQGLGDMAVSSSIGSNIFDVTVGLPLPWLAYSMSKNFAAVSVGSSGLFCSTILLFIMLIAVVITIALNKWRMTRVLGGTMFVLYVVFITLTILMQVGIFECFL